MRFDHRKMPERSVVYADSYEKAETIMSYCEINGLCHPETPPKILHRVLTEERFIGHFAVELSPDGYFGWCDDQYFRSRGYRMFSFDEFEWDEVSRDFELDESVFSGFFS